MLLARAIAYSVSPRRTVALTPGLGTDMRGAEAAAVPRTGAPPGVRTTVALLQAPSATATSTPRPQRRPFRTTRSTLIRPSLSI
ncbi:hypothetical protein NB717_002408 [Xanthomonas sacchari]|nr:hypothetical protein [Xanthomonas sacchari]